MKTQKRDKSTPKYTFYSVRIDRYEVGADFGTNVILSNPRLAGPGFGEERVYHFGGDLHVYGTVLQPEELANNSYYLHLIAGDEKHYRLDVTLKECQAVDEYRAKVFKSYRGQSVPVFDVPTSVGYTEKVRGEPSWNAAAFVKLEFLSYALSVLREPRPVYLGVHERMLDRRRTIQSFSIQTQDPCDG